MAVLHHHASYVCIRGMLWHRRQARALYLHTRLCALATHAMLLCMEAGLLSCDRQGAPGYMIPSYRYAVVVV